VFLLQLWPLFIDILILCFSFNQALVDYEGDSEEEEEEEEETGGGGVVIGSVESPKKDTDELESPNKRAKLT